MTEEAKKGTTYWPPGRRVTDKAADAVLVPTASGRRYARLTLRLLVASLMLNALALVPLTLLVLEVRHTVRDTNRVVQFVENETDPAEAERRAEGVQMIVGDLVKRTSCETRQALQDMIDGLVEAGVLRAATVVTCPPLP